MPIEIYDSTGAKMNVEIQRADKGAGQKRARCNSSMMDANLLAKDEDFDKLPETGAIFRRSRKAANSYKCIGKCPRQKSERGFPVHKYE